MKTIKFTLVVITLLLSAILVFQILNYINSKCFCEDSQNLSLLNQKINSLERELDSIKKDCCKNEKVFQVVSKGQIKQSVSNYIAHSKLNVIPSDFSDNSVNKEDTNKSVDSKEIKIEKKDTSATIIVEEYYKKDTHSVLNLYGKFDSIYYSHKYVDYLALKCKIADSRKELFISSGESLLGLVLIGGGFLVPDIKRAVTNNVNLNVDGMIINASIMSIQRKTNPVKSGLISAGIVLVFDGARRVIKTQKNLKSNLLEIESYPTGIGLKINF
jgi:hypothetical protein